MKFLPAKSRIISTELVISSLFNEKSNLSFYHSDLHKAYYELSFDTKYSDILEGLRFSESPVNPFSEEISEAISNLVFCNSLRSFFASTRPTYFVYSEFHSVQLILRNEVSEELILKLKDLSKDIIAKLESNVC